MSLDLLALVHHPHTIREWALNLMTHPEGRTWLLSNPQRFAAWYAWLSPHVTWPGAIRSQAPDLESAPRIKVTKRLHVFRAQGDMPFQGTLSEAYLRAYWEGVHVASWATRSPEAWEKAFAKVVRAHQRTPKSEEYARTALKHIQEAPHLLETELPDLAENRETLFGFNMLLLSVMVPFTTLEHQVIEWTYLLAQDEGTRLMHELMTSQPYGYSGLLAACWGCTAEEWTSLWQSSGRLAQSQLVRWNRDTHELQPLSRFWCEWLGQLAKTGEDFFKKLIAPFTKRPNAGALARLSPEDTTLVRALLRRRTQAPLGTNILLYGGKSVDKGGWVHDLLHQEGVSAFTLAEGVPAADRPSACYVAQRFVQRVEKEAVLVLPEAETILTRTQRGKHSFLFLQLELDDDVNDAHADPVLLEHNPVATIWLVHSPERLSENNLARFLFTSELRPASRAERRKGAEDVLKQLALSPSFLHELTQHTQLSEQQLKTVVNVIRRLERRAPRLAWNKEGLAKGLEPGTTEFREHMVRQVIEQSQKTLGRRQKEGLRTSITQYSTDYLNVAGTFPLDKVIRALKKNPQASLCFFGLPGTGKTQLAEHLAVVMDKPLMMRRASDILDKYLGESEKAIKAMFDEAADEEAILLLDEADTFLRDRRMARTQWEVSTVNELLQSMERFRGTFICTTNLFEHLDAACLRRFTFKLEFLALGEEQRWQMLCNEAAFDPSTYASEEVEQLRTELLLVKDLTPGDFATVQRQCHLLEHTLTVEQWIDALRVEAKAKMRDALDEQGGLRNVM